MRNFLSWFSNLACSRFVVTVPPSVTFMSGMFLVAGWTGLGLESAVAQTKSTQPANSVLAANSASGAASSNIRLVRKVPIVDRQIAMQHPLWPALELAIDSYKHIRTNITDYSCVVVRQEHADGMLQQQEFMQVKVRHSRTRQGQTVIPFSVYLKFLAPDNVEGREALFVEGAHEGDIFVRKGGTRFPFVTTRIQPDSEIAMQGNRHPITEMGFENLMRRLIDIAKTEIATNVETEVELFRDAKVDGRSCTALRVTHPVRDDNLIFQSAAIFLDNERNIPIHFESYDWPREEGGKLIPAERYTYRDIQLNQGFGDADFHPSTYNLK